MKAPVIPISALQKKGAVTLLPKGAKVNMSHITGFSKLNEPKEEKIYVTASHTEKSITLLLSDMRITVRKNGTKYERNTHNITVASDLQYANVIMGYITAQMKHETDITAFITAIQALNLTDKQINKDTDISVNAITKWLKENYPYVDIDNDVVNITDLFNMCEGYAKIAYNLSVKCGTASSIRIICNRLVPPVKKEKE